MTVITKFIPLLAISLAVVRPCFSQVQISVNGTVVTSGSNTSFDVTDYNTYQLISLGVRNISGINKNYIITRNRLIYPTSWNHYSATWSLETNPFGGICYTPTTDSAWTTPQSFLAMDNEAVIFEDFYTVSNDSCAHFRYFIASLENGIEDSLDIMGCSVVQINEHDFSDLTIYPNPTTDRVFISNSNTIESVQITNSLGRNIRSISIASNQVMLTLSDLAPGFYYLTIVTKEVVKIERIQIVR